MALKAVLAVSGLLLIVGCDGGQAGAQGVGQVAPAAVDGCEGCEAALERDPAALRPVARLAGADEPGDPLLVRGVVRRADGTPAAGVVVYAYHTGPEGRYAGGAGETQWARRHGRLRGWVKTGPDGRYQFRTVKPGPYPDRTEPAHVHLTVWEPGRPPYCIDSVVFRGESGVTPAYLARQEKRGGDGAVQLRRTPDGVLLAERDIVLAQARPG